MMRIGLTVSVVQGGRSGVATYVFGLLDGLRRIHAPVKMVLIGLANDRPLFEKWLDLCEWVPVAEFYRPAVRNVLWHQTVLRGVLRKHEIDVLHVPSYRRMVAKPPCPQVVTIHDCAAFAVRGKYDAARMVYGKYVVRALARQADVLTTVSHSTAADVERYFGVMREKVKVIWNGIDHDLFRPSEPVLIRKRLAEIGLHNPYFIYLARLEHPGKNHVRLLEAFEIFCARHPGLTHELVLGGADWHGAEVIHRRVMDSPNKSRIRCLGFVEKSDLPVLYAGATALVYPSLFEGFGLPLVESMASGGPVICSARGSLGEVAGEAACIIDPDSTIDMAEAMERVATDEKYRLELVRKGCERARAFSWDETARAVWQLYNLAGKS